MSPLPVVGTFGAATAISDGGLIVGYYQPGAFGRRAAKWVKGEFMPLPSLGGPLSEASDVSESGWIVGSGWTSAQASTTAALWIDDNVFDLSRRTLLASGDHLYDARGVNESGQIAGEGVFDQHFRGYILTPLRDGDVNGDDLVNADDLIAVVLTWGACPAPLSLATCPADLDGNGEVNADDLVSVILGWG
jgi:hypothetical protein